jgi:hypothetical protein
VFYWGGSELGSGLEALLISEPVTIAPAVKIKRPQVAIAIIKQNTRKVKKL